MKCFKPDKNAESVPEMGRFPVFARAKKITLSTCVSKLVIDILVAMYYSIQDLYCCSFM